MRTLTPDHSLESLDFSVRLRHVLRLQGPLLIIAAIVTLLSYEGAKVPTLGADVGLLGFALGLPILLRQTWLAIKEKQVNAESTMLVSAVGAVLLGQFPAASLISLMVVVMYTVELLASWRGAKDLTDLMSRAPTKANRLSASGKIDEVPVEELLPGDRIVVRQGDVVPADATVLGGSASLEESTLTGEPLPVVKSEGATILAGTRVIEGYVDARVEKAAGESYIQSLVREVVDNVNRRPPLKRLVDVIAMYFMPLVVALALLTYLVTRDAIAALAVLVVGSPCAILTATPIAFLATSAKVARQGILVKDGEILRKLGKVSAVVFDKTGTLTFGEPEVESVQAFEGCAEMEVLSAAASCEAPSPHPIAKAVIRYTMSQNVALSPLDDFRSEVGKGIVAHLGGKEYELGQPGWLAEQGVDVPSEVSEHIRVPGHDTCFTILLAQGRRPMGVLHLRDQMRESAGSAVSGLRSLGVKRILLLTGDKIEAADALASKLGIEAHGLLDPSMKVEVVRKLKSDGYTVAFVGDGVNDAPAMAVSDVSIAVALEGSTTASGVSQVVLTRGDLDAIPELVKRSRQTMAALYENVAVFAIVNALGMGLASLAIVTPAVGAVLHFLQESFGFVNSSRLAR